MRIWIPRSAKVFDKVGNAGHAPSTMHMASGTQVRPFDLSPQILKRRSRKSEGGQIVQELNSIREGKHWDNVKGGWLDPVLIWKARAEEIAVREEARGL